MSIGDVHPAEGHTKRDDRTGAVVRQVTSAPSIHHHPFFYIPAYDDSGERLYFISHRSGQPQVYLEDGPRGQLVQLTDRPDLDEWSVHPSHDGRQVYFTAGGGAWRVDVDKLREEQLANLGEAPNRPVGAVGAGMGTTSLSCDDRWWCMPVQVGRRFQLRLVDTSTGEWSTIVEHDLIAHPQFHPDDPIWLRFAGHHSERLWIVRRDGTEKRLVYQRDADAKEWIVHETWLPGRREIIAAKWPHGIISVDVDTGVDSGHVRWVTRANAWHPMVSRDGTRVVADTVHPDVGLMLFDAWEECGPTQTLCYPGASNVGDHWQTNHCPYDDGPIEVYAPQHTHPHPSFSPDGRRVVFTSDRSGMAQVYEVGLPEDFITPVRHAEPGVSQ